MATKTETTVKTKKAPVALVQRLTDQMKRGTLNNKLSKEDLDTISNLSAALKTFLG